jgi:hypothetical protein
MKVGVVLRSVAILLGAPLLALPAGGAEDDPAPLSAARAPAPASLPVAVADAPPAERATTPPPAKPASPVRVVVDCAQDGCVVQTGLDVLVVGP